MKYLPMFILLSAVLLMGGTSAGTTEEVADVDDLVSGNFGEDNGGEVVGEEKVEEDVAEEEDYVKEEDYVEEEDYKNRVEGEMEEGIGDDDYDDYEDEEEESMRELTEEEVATEKQKMADVDMKLTMARRERSLQNMRTIVSYVKMAVEPIHLICVRVGISPYIDLIFDYLLDKPLQGTTILSVIITALFIVTGKKKKRSPAKETKDKEDETTKEDEASTETTQVESMEQNKTPSRVRRRKA